MAAMAAAALEEAATWRVQTFQLLAPLQVTDHDIGDYMLTYPKT